MEDKNKPMPEFETLKSGVVKYGKNKFIEISTKRVKEEGREQPFINMMRGTFDQEGLPKYSKGFGFPKDPKLVDDLIAELKRHRD
jgi:hypothetical protein